MTFDRLRPKDASEISLLADVLDSLHRNERLIRGQIEGAPGILQLYWPGHCFGLVHMSEVAQLKDAIQFELMCWGASERKVYL